MFNLDEEQASLRTLATGAYDSLNHVSSLDEIRSNHLIHIWKVRMAPPHLCL